MPARTFRSAPKSAHAKASSPKTFFFLLQVEGVFLFSHYIFCPSERSQVRRRLLKMIKHFLAPLPLSCARGRREQNNTSWKLESVLAQGGNGTQTEEGKWQAEEKHVLLESGGSAIVIG